MLCIKIVDSYTVWRPKQMFPMLKGAALEKYGVGWPAALLNRSYKSMYIEWWAHNIGYYVTLPFIFVPAIKKINLRCKDVDLEEHER